jgi:thiamine-phosphate pyrophosphorylase
MNGRSLVTERIATGGLYGLTAEKFSLGRPNAEVVRAMLDAGVRIIQYREKTKKIDLALLVDADGVHVGQEDLPVAAVRRLVGADRAIGLSTHSPEQARAAVAAGADYIGVGPIFATRTKDDVCAPVGLSYLDYVVREIALPFVAIGGIKEHNLGEVAGHGARCAALVTEIVGARDIAEKAAALRRILG